MPHTAPRIPNLELAVPLACTCAGRTRVTDAVPRLPAGSYTVKAWHPDFGEITRTVKVPGSDEVTLDLAY